MMWKSAHDAQVRKYDFAYDAVNRLTNADFNQWTAGGFNKTALVDFSAGGLTYDANGNIMGMNQMGLVNNAVQPIDQLRYTYFTGTNRLQQVVDTANNNASLLGDFKYDASAKTATDYGYDGNGNLTSDANKKISSIAYNHLNLPQVISVDGKGTIAYTYDAAGNKLQKTTVDNLSGKITVTNYINGTIYENDTLRFISSAEGRIRPNSSNSGFVFDYYLKDHLGNTRMTITDDATVANHIVDAESYYPFGLEMAGIGYKVSNGLENKLHKFNGWEKNVDLDLNVYESFYRVNDYGRFWQIDPKADSLYGLSPYSSMVNNLISITDPNGDIIQFADNSFAEFKLKFIIAAVTLLTKGVGSDLIQLAGSEKTYTLHQTDGLTNSFSDNGLGTGGDIKWNPNKGIRTSKDIDLSPTTLLNHELDHAAAFDLNPKAFFDRALKGNKDYGDEEEKRVISGMEQKTALALGEMTLGQITRTDHGAKYPFIVSWPNTTSGGNPIFEGSGGAQNVIIRAKRIKSKTK